jgi:CheY-like chemotaxis protein
MIVLIIEDTLGVIEELTGSLTDLNGNLHLAKSRDAALKLLSDLPQIDVAVLDLKIPTADDRLDADVEHGLLVLEALQRHHPGTPVKVFTSFGSEDIYADRVLPLQRQIDLWGEGTEYGVVAIFRKNKLREVIAQVLGVGTKLLELGTEVELNSDFARESIDDRIIRTFARRQKARTARISRLSGGLSGSKVYRLTLNDDRGALRLISVAKLDTLSNISQEYAAYTSEVVRLPNGSFSGYVDSVRNGCGQRGGLFYQLLDGYDANLFDVIASDEPAAVRIVGILQNFTSSWYSGIPQSQGTIGAIRAAMLRDSHMGSVAPYLDGIDFARFERRSIQQVWCTQHGDLHGGNVLIRNQVTPVLIDFGRVSPMTASLDPLTLELSLLFHPDARDRFTWKPNVSVWRDIDEYAKGCPYPGVLRACRTWTTSVCAGQREVYATIYAYAMRQFRFVGAGVNAGLAREFVQMAISELART